jgi:hypothetical protein
VEQGYPMPPPGPRFSVLPVPVERIARITPIGYNNKIFPNPHTYREAESAPGHDPISMREPVAGRPSA